MQSFRLAPVSQSFRPVADEFESVHRSFHLTLRTGSTPRESAREGMMTHVVRAVAFLSILIVVASFVIHEFYAVVPLSEVLASINK